MKRFLSLLLTCILSQSAFYFVLLPTNISAQTAGAIAKQQETLNNESIIQMLNAGLGDAIIIAKIKSSKVSFDTSSPALQSLKKQGISDSVVLAMVQKESGMEVSSSNTKPTSVNTTGGLAQSTGTIASNNSSSTTFGLLDGTPIKLRISRTMSSADAKTGETVDFEVLEDVKIGDTIVIPRGGTALGTVTQGKPKARMGKGGKLDINIDSVRLVSGDKIPLRAVKETKGGGHTGAMTGAIVATSIVFFPAAPFFLFMKGKDITIPKGTEITAYINGDIPLDSSKFNTTSK